MIQSLSILSGILGALTFIAGAVAWYRSTVTKSYAAQRDFESLRASQQQIADNQRVLIDQLRQHLAAQDKEFGGRFDRLHRDLLDVKGMFYASIKQGQ